MSGDTIAAKTAEKKVAAQRGPSYPFCCSRDFPADFEYAWGFPARCAVCGKEIQGREVIRWQEVSNPWSVVHVGCEGEADADVLRQKLASQAVMGCALDTGTTSKQDGRAIRQVPGDERIVD